MTTALTELKWPTMAETRKRARRTIKGWVELRGHKPAKPKLAKFTINYVPRISAATKRLLANAWTAYVQTTFGSQHMRPLGRFHNPAKAMEEITAKWKPRNEQATHFGNGSRMRYEAEVVEICAELEAELADLADDEAAEYMEAVGLTTTGTADFTFPLNLGFAKTLMAGKTPIKLTFQGQYFVTRPDVVGSSWGVFFQVTPVVRVPW